MLGLIQPTSPTLQHLTWTMEVPGIGEFVQFQQQTKLETGPMYTTSKYQTSRQPFTILQKLQLNYITTEHSRISTFQTLLTPMSLRTVVVPTQLMKMLPTCWLEKRVQGSNPQPSFAFL